MGILADHPPHQRQRRPTAAFDPALWESLFSTTLGLEVPVLSSLPRHHQTPLAKCAFSLFFQSSEPVGQLGLRISQVLPYQPKPKTLNPRYPINMGVGSNKTNSYGVIVMLLMCREATRLLLDPAPVRQRKVAVVLAALRKTAAEGSRGFEAIVQPVLLKP